MQRIMLDEDTDCREFYEACQREGIADCCRITSDLKGRKDDSVIADAISRGRTILTKDKRMLGQWTKCLNAWHPGIVVVSLEDNSGDFMTHDHAASIIHDFKSEFPNWNDIDCDNSIVEIRPNLVTISHVVQGQVKLTGFMERADAAWQVQVQGLLTSNAARLLPPP